ncbi:MAG: AbiV family abortive infection protein [Nitrosotalea sp.]
MKYISYTELEKAFDVGKDNVDRLLKDSKHLYEQTKYPNSIALSILSYEEIAKLHFIVQHQIEKKDIMKTEWKNISSAGSHEKKLTAIYIDAHKKTQKMSKEQYESIIKSEKKLGSNIPYRTFEENNKISGMITKRLAKLNLIKQYCWYLEITNKEFVTISEIYNKNNLRVLSYWLLNVAHLEFLTILLGKKFPNYWMWTIPAEVSLLRKDPLYLAIQTITKEIYSKQFTDVSTRVAIMIDTFPKRLEDLPKK